MNETALLQLRETSLQGRLCRIRDVIVDREKRRALIDTGSKLAIFRRVRND